MKNLSFLEIYQSLIAIPSISSTESSWDQSNIQLIENLATWFKDINFDVEIIEVEAGKYNFLARKGEGDGGLLLSGHSDTVPFDEKQWNFNPFSLIEKNNRFYGLGTADMKGFFAFIYEAVKKVDWNKQQKPLYILATCDEETSMQGARHFIKNAPFTPDCCIIGEPTELIPIHAHKGHLANVIRVTGKSGHSSDPSLGINAIDIMHEILFALTQLRNKLIKTYHHPAFAIPTPTMNFGHIHGGDSANRICACCELHFDIRPLPGMSLASLEGLIEDALKELKAKWTNRIEMKSLYPPASAYECKENHPFVFAMEKLCQQKAQTVNYCTEAPYLQTLCPTLVLGPGSIEQAHQPNEYLSLDFINPTLDMLTKTINKYCF